MNWTDLCRAAVPLTINLLILGSVIALGVTLALMLTRAASPRARYIVVVAAFLAAVFLPVLATLRGGGPEVRSLASTRVDPLAPVAPSPRAPRPSYLKERFGTVVDRLAESRVGTWLFGSWLLGAALLLAREGIGHALLTRSRRQWLPAPGALRRQLEWPESVGLHVHDLDGPSTVGLIHAQVVLPARLFRELSHEAIFRVARHELAHAQWRDPLVGALLRLISALLWPSFPLWLLLRQVVIEREASADAAAIRMSDDPADHLRAVEDYASSLLAIARWSAKSRATRPLTAQITDWSRFEVRVRRLLHIAEPPSRAREALAAGLLVCTLVGTALLPVSSAASDLATALEARSAIIEERALENLGRTGGSHFDAAHARERVHRATQATIALIGSLPARDWRLTGETKSALDEIESSRTIEPLLETLQDDDRRVRERSAWALGQLRDSKAVEVLIAALTDRTEEVRHTTAWALGRIGDRRAVEPLTENLADSHFEARHGAAWALGEIGDPRAVRPLILAMIDESADVRHGAAWALGMIADGQARESLSAAAVEDVDPEVRRAAASALERLHAGASSRRPVDR